MMPLLAPVRLPSETAVATDLLYAACNQDRRQPDPRPELNDRLAHRRAARDQKRAADGTHPLGPRPRHSPRGLSDNIAEVGHLRSATHDPPHQNYCNKSVLSSTAASADHSTCYRREQSPTDVD